MMKYAVTEVASEDDVDETDEKQLSEDTNEDNTNTYVNW